MIKKYKQNNKGQSLVEVVVACGIIGIVIASIMAMVIATKNLLYTSEDQTKATALAQEGIEIARHQRDIGCNFKNITDSNGSLTSNSWYIKGDTVGPSDPDNDSEKLVSTGTPDKIENFDGFSRIIYIYPLTSSNGMGINTATFGKHQGSDADCNNIDENYDCVSKYYSLRVEIKKDGNTLSDATTIISRE